MDEDGGIHSLSEYPVAKVILVEFQIIFHNCSFFTKGRMVVGGQQLGFKMDRDGN